jgi:exo-beta-1,3-glucanase (GH17 family)/cellulose synthase/poly-beta-1,6-N-acetylglucosamine synthase-like glycosyltransferase
MRNIVLAIILGALVQAVAWFASYESTDPPEVTTRVQSVSFDVGGPQAGTKTITELDLSRIGSMLDRVKTVSSNVRTYAARGLAGEVPRLADERDISVTLGIWLSPNEAENRKEIAAALELTRRYPNIHAISVGNETLVRRDLTAEELISYIRDVRRRTRLPVTTSETWDKWIAHPELVREVDYISAHVLPYWEGIPAKAALEFTLGRYEELRQSFPGKRVVISEFGWPSQGSNMLRAVPDALTQADLVRGFLIDADRMGMEYNLMEAYDQPWKTNEGNVGPYWGLFDASGNQKFSLQGEVNDKNHGPIAAIAMVLGALLTAIALGRRQPSLGHAAAVSFSAQALAAGMALALAYPFDNYLNTGSAIAWIIGFLLMLPLTAMTLLKLDEVAEVTVGNRPVRLLPERIVTPPGFRYPKVSIQVPAYRENPAMLNETLSSLSRLDYPDFEVLVIINNTPDETLTKPVEEHCRALGPHFKFLNLQDVKGFKAGALTLAMDQVADDAEVLALIDADYVVDRDWLKDLTPAFADPRMAFVQAPQDHRDGPESAFKTAINSEYAGFFDIGMVQRNERNALIAHGTMLLIRRTAFDEVGGWSTATITEDTELGLRLLEAGYEGTYTNRRYGWGLLPDTYEAFKTQRHRWAYGAMQIIRKHWPHMKPKAEGLNYRQKTQFIAGWSYWISDAFGVLTAFLNLIWVPMILLADMMIPVLPFTLPILVAFGVNLVHCILLYLTRVKIPPQRIFGAAVAAMSLQYTVAHAVGRGLVSDALPFKVTAKGGGNKSKRNNPIRTEAIVGVLLLCGAAALILSNENQIFERYVFAGTLMVQSLPFLAAPILYGLERLSEALLNRRNGTRPPQEDDSDSPRAQAA